jgi:hypothetical protein
MCKSTMFASTSYLLPAESLSANIHPFMANHANKQGSLLEHAREVQDAHFSEIPIMYVRVFPLLPPLTSTTAT